jgi:hypothetical protein
MRGSRNIFAIGRVPHREDQLTEMLVWLCSAVPEVTAAIVALGFGEPPSHPEEIEIATQHSIAEGRLDAVFRSQSFILVVESKLESGFHDNQVRKYLEWLAHEHAGSLDCGLMTLTKYAAKWFPDDEDYARKQHITPSRRRWQDLYLKLEELAQGHDGTDLATKLMREFMEMLSEEDLIPVNALTADELGTAWWNSRALIRRYRDFYAACRDEIAGALDAEPASKAGEHTDHIWQDFVAADDTRIVVGFYYTDEGHPLKPKVYTRSPILWLAPEAKHWGDWSAAARWLEEHPPEGWRVATKRWWDRPQTWRYLSDVIGGGDFDEQRAHLCKACKQGREWMDAAREIYGS